MKRRKIVKGYINIYDPNNPDAVKKYILEHRKVVQDYIKRRLTKKEVVHHIDSNKQNNNINNLMLFPNHKEHMKFHLKIKQFGFTRPILRQIKNRWDKYHVGLLK